MRYKEETEHNKELKAIRQKSKSVTFGLSYGAFPKKVAKSIKCDVSTAQQIFDNYHNVLYSDITKMRNKVLEQAKKYRKVHLGLGCYLRTSNPDADIRTLFNANSQFWSILTLLVINKLNSLISENNLEKDVEVISSIYDAIYLHVTKCPEIIKWVNDKIIELMTRPYLTDLIVPNEAEGEIGYNWTDTVKIPNNADIETIKKALGELDGI